MSGGWVFRLAGYLGFGWPMIGYRNVPMIEYRHVVNVSHVDGFELQTKLAWCGASVFMFDWAFQSAQHVLQYLQKGAGEIFPCRPCLAEISDVALKEIAV